MLNECRIDPNQAKEKEENENKFELKKNELDINLSEGNISGVRAIFDLISQEKIPLIFHNGIYDLLQVFSFFFFLRIAIISNFFRFIIFFLIKVIIKKYMNFKLKPQS